MSDARVILCTCPDQATARRLAGKLVGARLAACVNVMPAVLSIYRWREVVEEEEEVLMVIKSTDGRWPELRHWLEQNHPYDVPEIVALPVAGISGPYEQWLLSATSAAPEQ